MKIFQYLFIVILAITSSIQVVHAGDLTITKPKSKELLRLGDTLEIEATGAQARAILSEVENTSVPNRKLGLFLMGVEIPEVRSSYHVSQETIESNSLLGSLKEKLSSVEKDFKDAQTRFDDPKVSDPKKNEVLEEKRKGLEEVRKSHRDAEEAFSKKAKVTLSFFIERNSESDSSRQAWNTIFGLIPFTSRSPLEIALSVGAKSAVPVGSVDFSAAKNYGYGCAAGFAMLVICAIILGTKPHMLRENGDTAKPFSLGRSQMAIWGIVVLVSFVGVAVATYSLEHIPAQVLVLLGISATTALGAAVMDGDSQTKPEDKSPRRGLIGFFDDICIGDKGASFHRVQVVLWTVVLCGYFVWNVFQFMSMPEFSSTLLVLMGISNGTYLSFKPSESKSSRPDLSMSELKADQNKISLIVGHGAPPYTWEVIEGHISVEEASGSLNVPGQVEIKLKNPLVPGSVKVKVTDHNAYSQAASITIK